MWYKETQGTLGFKLMGNLSGEMDQIETEFKNKIKNLTVHSTGMTQCSKLPLSNTKTLMVYQQKIQPLLSNYICEFGDVDEKKFEAQKSVPESGSLKVNHLEPDDSGIYFCAVSEHSVSKAGECCTKTFCA
uniref:Immunoglobulin V-set domain-containing protein n=1 Tax=Cyprinus carpio TaxID=7962 RepID=A0A8C1RBX5_CYPCA